MRTLTPAPSLTGGERSVSLDEAERRVRGVLAGMGLVPDLSSWDDGCEPTTWSCGLRQIADGRPVRKGEGLGKGSAQQARVGALFEALEHYLTGPGGHHPEDVRMRSAAALAAGSLRAEASAVVLRQDPDVTLACHSYASLTEEGDDLLVPLYLSAPWYVDDPAARVDTCDYSQLARYSCNSGSAIGVTLTEALVHALNETIERDAFSLLLARAFLGRTDHRLSVVDAASLPTHLGEAHRRAEQLGGAPVALIDITTDLGVPTMMAYTPPTDRRPHYRGVGTSLSPDYAAWRALTELVQCLLGVAREAEPPSADLTGLAAYPALHACGRFDLTAHLATARSVGYQSQEASDDPRHHLDCLVTRLSAAGYRPYYRVVASLPEEITAVHTIVPGLERFMLVTDGLLVLPGPRARAAATSE